MTTVGVNLYRSNRPEVLAELMARLTDEEPLMDPMRPEAVVVPSSAMGSWLLRRLAQGQGIAANLVFLKPAELMQQTLERCQAAPGTRPDGAQARPTASQGPPDPWERDPLVWAILGCLSELPEAARVDRTLEPLLAYLEGESGEVITRRRYGLARTLAELFDRYLLYRPAWALAFSSGQPAPGLTLAPEEAWQPRLWRHVQEHLGLDVWHLARRFEAALARPRMDDLGWERLWVFGFSTLPPLYLELLALLGRGLEVNLMLLCPSAHLWVGGRRLGPWTQGGPPRSDVDPERRTGALHEPMPDGAEDNPLLASLGRLAREFQELLSDLPGGCQDRAPLGLPGFFVDPLRETRARACALTWLKSDIFEARSARAALALDGAMPRRLLPDDDSLHVHVCHGPMRQVEVLRQVLLGLLEDHPDLQPRDIRVVVPDIVAFAPLITAVFEEGDRPGESPDPGLGVSRGPRLGYRIDDLGLRQQNPLAEAMLRVLTLAISRRKASEVMGILALEPVQRRFGIEAKDLPEIERWVGEAGIRWGLDASERQRQGLPLDGANTWQFGLERLVLGVAMPEESRLFCGVLPCESVEGQSVALLGRFLRFAVTLLSQARILGQPRPVAEWGSRLLDALEALIEPGPGEADQAVQVREALIAFAEAADLAGPHRLLDPEALLCHVNDLFEAPRERLARGANAVTFCGPERLRGLPQRVLVLMGLDEEAWPRSANRPSFDLMKARPLPGDRDITDEDRLLFLEAILSAEEHLVLLYTGRDPQSGESRAASPLVEELLEVIDESMVPADGNGSASRRLTTVHPLQGFSPRSFVPRPAGSDDDRPGPRPESVPRPRSSEAGEAQIQAAPTRVRCPAGAQSFDGMLCQAAGALHEARNRAGHRGDEPFFTALDEPAPLAEDPIALSAFIAFFQHPVRFFVLHRLGLDLGEHEEILEDREPMELDGLRRWEASLALLGDALAGVPPEASQACMRGRGILPLGSPGQLALEPLQQTALTVAEVVSTLRRGHEPRPPLPVELELELPPSTAPSGSCRRVRLVGQIEDRWGSRLIQADIGAEKGSRLVGPWIRCLLWTALHPDDEPASILVLGEAGSRDGQVRAIELSLHDAPVGQRGLLAMERLRELASLFLDGQHRPLPLLPRSSLVFAETLSGRLDASRIEEGISALDPSEAHELERALDAALRAWDPGRGSAGGQDGMDPNLTQVFGSDCPLLDDNAVNPEFARLALQVWGPLLANRKELEVGP